MSETSARPVFKKVFSRHGIAPAPRSSEAATPPVTIFNTPTAFAPADTVEQQQDIFAQSQTMDLPVDKADEVARALLSATRFAEEGTAYLTQGKFDEAERLFMLSLHVSESYLGTTNVGLAQPLERLASFYLTRASYQLASPLLKRLYEIRLAEHLASLQSSSGVQSQARENYLLMALTVEKCSSCLEKLNMLSQCEVIYLTLLKRQEEYFGADHAFTQDALERLGNFYLRARVYGLAKVVFEKIYDSKARIHGKYSMEVSAILSSLALIYNNLELFFDQVAVLETQVFLLDTVHGGTGLSLASALTRLADALSLAAHDHEAGAQRDKELTERAELIYRRALTIFEKHYGPQTPTVVNLRSRLQNL